MSNTFIETLLVIEAKGTLILDNAELPWDIKDYQHFCKLFGFTTEAEIALIFQKILDFPISAQWQQPKARRLIQIIQNFNEFKDFVAKRPFQVPFFAQQTVLEQWLAWTIATLKTHAENPALQILAFTRLLSTLHEHVFMQSIFFQFLNQLEPRLPQHLTPILEAFKHSPFAPPSQSTDIIFLSICYQEAHGHLGNEAIIHLAKILNFHRDVALKLLASLFSTLEAFPEDQLLQALSQKKISSNCFLQITQSLPVEQRGAILKKMRKEAPEHQNEVFEFCQNELPRLSANERDIVAGLMNNEPCVPPVLLRDIRTLNIPSISIEEQAKRKKLGRFKSYVVTFGIKTLIFGEIYRSFYTQAFGKLLQFAHLQEESYSEHYAARLTKLKTLLVALNSECLAEAQDDAISCLANCARPLVDPALLFELERHVTDPGKQTKIYDSLLKTESPFTSLIEKFTMSVRACL